MFTLTVLINILFSNSLDLKVSISIPPKNSIFFSTFRKQVNYLLIETLGMTGALDVFTSINIFLGG